VIGGAAAAAVLIAVGVLVFTGGDNNPSSGGPVSVASKTTVKNPTTAPQGSNPSGQSSTSAGSSDPDATCKAALQGSDKAAPFQQCNAYQYRRLQPQVAPNRPDLDTACRQVTYGDACIFIPTTLPPPPFQATSQPGQGNGSVPLPSAAAGGIIDVRYDGSGPLTLSTTLGQLLSASGPWTGRLYVGNLSAAQAVQVTASGGWTIGVLPLNEARDATLRAVGQGTEVLRLDNPTEKAVRFTYDGTDHFQVIGHPLVGPDQTGAVAVDQAGPVDTTVTLRGAIIEIRGSGHWTIIPS
jgi:hypothetical protein